MCSVNVNASQYLEKVNRGYIQGYEKTLSKSQTIHREVGDRISINDKTDSHQMAWKDGSKLSDHPKVENPNKR